MLLIMRKEEDWVRSGRIREGGIGGKSWVGMGVKIGECCEFVFATVLF